MEAGKHTEQDNFTIVKFAKELPFSVADSHEIMGNDFPVSQVVVSSPCPVPHVAPQYPVQFVKCFL